MNKDTMQNEQLPQAGIASKEDGSAKILIRKAMNQVRKDSSNWYPENKWYPNESMETLLVNNKMLGEHVESVRAEGKNIPEESIQRWIKIHGEKFEGQAISFEEKKNNLLDKLIQRGLEAAFCFLNISLNVHQLIGQRKVLFSSKETEAKTLSGWEEQFNAETSKLEIIIQLTHPDFHKSFRDSLQSYLIYLDPKETEKLQDTKNRGITKCMEQNLLMYINPSVLERKKQLIKSIFNEFYQEELILALENNLGKIPDIFHKDRLDELLAYAMPSDIAQKPKDEDIKFRIKKFVKDSQTLLRTQEHSTASPRPR